MIPELECVALLVDLPELGLKAGDIGTVVHVYPSGAAYEVEFVDLDGWTIGVETLEQAQIRLARRDELERRSAQREARTQY